MDLYLPVANLSVNAVVIILLGGGVGFLSGMFGVGGGFLITPLLFFIGVPPPVAVATGANQVVASSISGVLAQLRRKGVDFQMGTVLLFAGIAGSAIGVWVFSIMTRLGQVDLFVQLSYVLFLGLIGAMMLQESLRSLMRSRRPGGAPIRRAHVHSWAHGLPFKMKFRASGLYISVIPPALIGAAVGLPTKVVIGTSLFQIIFVSAFTTVMHAVTSQTVDMMLALLLILGGVIGAQIGTRVGVRLKAEQLRILLSLLVLTVSIRIAADLLVTPDELYSVAPVVLP